MKVKNSKNITVGDTIDLALNSLPYKTRVTALDHQHRPTPKARLLYTEDMDIATRREQQRLLDQTSRVSAAHPDGRPTKYDRHQLDRVRWEGW